MQTTVHTAAYFSARYVDLPSLFRNKICRVIKHLHALKRIESWNAFDFSQLDNHSA